MNKTKKPRIRFKGFTDDWEQRKLGHIVGRVTRKNKDLVSNLPLTISAQYGLIDQNEFFDKRIASKDVSNYYLIHKGEFAYNKSTSTDAPWGAIKRLDRYENGVLSTLYIIFRILDENQVDSDYLASYYNTALWYKSIRMIAAEGARNHGLLNIAPDDFFETTLMIPRDIAEQKKIGAYLKNLDDLITLHQRKCEKLKIIKKSMIENCFPKNGQKVPKIRFSGFTGDWEQRKVGDLCYMKGRIGWQGLKSSDFISKGPYCVTGTDFYNGKIQWEKCYHVSEARYNMDPYIQLKPGDLLITKDGTIGKLAFIDNLPGKACLNSHLLVIRPNEPAELSNIYLFQVFSSELFLAYYTQSGTGSTMKSLSQGVISNFKISLPCIDEQKKIGDYLKNVDDLITLHQRKLEKLKKIKKSMLERMFV